MLSSKVAIALGRLVVSWTAPEVALIEADTGEPRWVFRPQTDIGVDRTMGDAMMVSTRAGHVLAVDLQAWR